MASPTLQPRVRLAPLTTLGVGGPCDQMAEVQSSDLPSVLEQAREQEQAVLLLGGGSNLLVADAGFRGLVMRLGDKTRSVSAFEDRVQVRVAGPEGDVVFSAEWERATGDPPEDVENGFILEWHIDWTTLGFDPPSPLLLRVETRDGSVFAPKDAWAWAGLTPAGEDGALFGTANMEPEPEPELEPDAGFMPDAQDQPGDPGPEPAAEAEPEPPPEPPVVVESFGGAELVAEPPPVVPEPEFEVEPEPIDGCGCRQVGHQSGRSVPLGGFLLASCALLLWIRRRVA